MSWLASEWRLHSSVWGRVAPHAVAVLVLALNCNGLTGADGVRIEECVPGERASCPCPGRSGGFQTCAADSRYAVCDCRLAGLAGTSSGGGGGAGPAGPPGRGGAFGAGRGGASATLPANPSGGAGGSSRACPPNYFEQDGSCHLAAVQIAAGFFHDCALLQDGTVRCWGDNDSGQLGDGTVESREGPVRVVGLAGVQRIAVGDDHGCALVDGGTVLCWGDNEYLQLGDGSTADSPTPKAVPGVTGAIDIAANSTRTCALLANGGASCWGESGSVTVTTGLTGSLSALATDDDTACGVLPDAAVQCWPISGVAETRLSGSIAISLAASALHFCAISVAGTVQCWGYNAYGQLGDGTTTTSRVPVEVIGLAGVTSLGTGLRHTCAVIQGSVRCWGNGESGELGSDIESAFEPTLVPGLSDVFALAGGVFHSCALKTEGSVYCWGSAPLESSSSPLAIPGW
jgi:hypothetical protein